MFSDSKIAVCGYGFRLPGGIESEADVLKLFLERRVVQEPIDDRYGKGATILDGSNTSNHPCAFASPYEGLIKNGKELEFDCTLFGMSRNEAKRMDPQVKMMLNCTWEALRHAGMSQMELHNSNTGVFIGCSGSCAWKWKAPFGTTPSDVSGKASAMLANRISYHFNWMGPSVMLDTACSSGVTALDASIKALRTGECDMATFGAVNHLGSETLSHEFNSLGVMSPTGSCRSFDKDANGYMRSEGAFVYILKRLEDAERKGDKIFGVIRGCGLNTSGAEAGAGALTQGRMIVAPTQHAQEFLMKKVAQEAGINPMEIDYVEAHATGTQVGDTTEGKAIASVYGGNHRSKPLLVASTRSSLGHMEGASFTSSFLRVLIMFQKKQFLPMSEHFNELNPNLPFAANKVFVLTSTKPFPIGDRNQMLVGINSFGFGGANGHCIVEEYRPTAITYGTWSSLPSGDCRGQKVYTVPLSAKSEEALVENVRALKTNMENISPNMDMYTLVANLSVRTTIFRVRTSFQASSFDQLYEQLVSFLETATEKGGPNASEIAKLEQSKLRGEMRIAMVFPGQGSQWAGCGKDLYESEVVFRRVVDAIDDEWVALSGHKLSSVAFEGSQMELNRCDNAQPVTFMLQAALFEMLKTNGIYPSVVLGHSAGEAAAAYACGAYSLKEACQLVYERSRLQAKTSGSGRMLVLRLSRLGVEEALRQLGFRQNAEGHMSVHIACFNSPNNTVVCGTSEAIMSLQESLQQAGLDIGKLIPGDIAFHSSLMNPIREEFMSVLAGLHDGQHHKSSVPFISTVTGKFQDTFDTPYWWSNVREPVNLVDAVRHFSALAPDVIIEVSPHITLRSPIRDCYAVKSGETLPDYIFTLIRNTSTSNSFARSVGDCFRSGLNVDFRSLYPRPRPISHLLPEYFMKKDRINDDVNDETAFLGLNRTSSGPLIGSKSRDCKKRNFKSLVSSTIYPWMIDHVVQGAAIMPAAGYVELILEAFRGEGPLRIELKFNRALIVSEDSVRLSTEIGECGKGSSFNFSIASKTQDQSVKDSTNHCRGVAKVVSEKELRFMAASKSIKQLSDVQGEFDEVLFKDVQSFYETLSGKIGENFKYGPAFQSMRRLRRDTKTGRMCADLAIDLDQWERWDAMGYILHPSLLDGAFQTFITGCMESTDFVSIPQSADILFFQKPLSNQLTAIFEPKPSVVNEKGQPVFMMGENDLGNLRIYDGTSGELVMWVQSLRAHFTNHRTNLMRKARHFLSWQPKSGCWSDTTIVATVDALSKGTDLPGASKLLLADAIKTGHPDGETPFFVNAGEFIIGHPPNELALAACVEAITNGPVQYSVISSEGKLLKSLYSAYGMNHDANLRFIETRDFSAHGESSFLRPGMFEVIVVHVDAGISSEHVRQALNNMIEMLSPGGLLLLESNGHLGDLPSKRGLQCLWKTAGSSGIALYKNASISECLIRDGINQSVSLSFVSDNCGLSHISNGDRTLDSTDHTWVIVDDNCGFSRFWRESIETGARQSIRESYDLEDACKWRRVDLFAMDGTNLAEGASDQDLVHPVASILDWIKPFVSMRRGVATTDPCIFTIFTSGAVGANVTSPVQTSIWGAMRSIILEVADQCKVDFRLVDVATKEDLLLVFSGERMRERELSIVNGTLWTSRLVNIREAHSCVTHDADGDMAYNLHSDNTGSLNDLHFKTRQLPQLRESDVEVEVKAAALNFRDIMVGLGRLPLLSYEKSMAGPTMGLECSGVVTKCGKAATKFKVGDRVIANQGGCIANKIRGPEHQIYALPDNLSFEEGASVFTVYATAYYGLVHLAHLRRGHTVLIHSGMGGVGQAAIALAKLEGAVVYATAGSEEKREALLEMGCANVFDSHSTDWYYDLMSATAGRGVNVVLNSLAGEHVDLCLASLAPCGWHLEIGKVDIYEDRPLNMAVFRKNATYRAIDIDRLYYDDPETAVQVADATLDLLRAGKVPALPYVVFPYNEHRSAFRYMLNGLHKGKVVLTPPTVSNPLEMVDHRPLFSGVRDNGGHTTTLLSGCLGGFGIRIIRYVVSQGAKNIVVLDRDEKRRRSVDWLLQKAGLAHRQDLCIKIVRADVSSYKDVLEAVESVSKFGMPALGAVFHLAALLDDKYAMETDRKLLAKVFGPKANGAWNLHCATANYGTVKHFVMLSSIVSVLGNTGQSAYAAANAFQDGLAEYRRKFGMPALSFCMGPLAEVGMLAGNGQLLEMFRQRGMPAISSVFAVDGLDAALRSGNSSNAVVAVTTNLSADIGSNDFLRAKAQLVGNAAAFEGGESGVSMSKDALIDVLSERVAALCGVQEVDPSEPFSSYGLNSMSVSELFLFLSQEMAFTGTLMELMTSATCESIVDKIVSSAKQAPKEEQVMNSDDKKGAEDLGIGGLNPPIKAPSSFSSALEEHFSTAPRLGNDLVTITPRPFMSIWAEASDEPTSPHQPTGNSIVAGQQTSGLPQQCQETLDNLMANIQSIDGTNLQPETPVCKLQCILVTGATGFFGRHFIAELLKSSPKVNTVLCPIRADNDSKALRRLIDSMEEAGLWEETFRCSIHAFASDLAKPRFGVSREAHSKLAMKAEAVFHFAASVKLSASFKEAEGINCTTTMEVITFCLVGRRKHLFHASTLGIFPQYYCRFANEMSDRPIGFDAKPDITEMKKFFPLEFCGYPWSKLLSELAVLAAGATKGLPLAVFRLPYVFVNGKTGYTVADDFTMQYIMAMNQTNTMPIMTRLDPMEDASACIEVILGVAFNPQRKHHIYNCSIQSVAVVTESQNPLLMLGFPGSATSYRVFKAKCSVHGRDAPMHSFWILSDHFRNYWIDPQKKPYLFPISIKTLQEDCLSMPIAKPYGQIMERSLWWIFQHPNLWPFDVKLLRATLDLPTILNPAKILCRQYGLDFEAVVPLPVQEGLRRILSEIVLPPEKELQEAYFLTQRLEGRVQLYRLFRKIPEIVEEEIDRPIFILGLHRTGTTLLHRILESSGCIAAPHLEEQFALPDADQIISPDPEIEESRRIFLKTFFDHEDTVKFGLHHFATSVAEEDFCAHQCYFQAIDYDLMYNLPNYRRWVDAQSHDEVYREHRQWLQYMSWCRRRAGKPVTRWCCKMPVHARSLPALLKAYPDAVFVHTHRSPIPVAGSWFALVEALRRVPSDRAELGREQMQVMEFALESSMKFRHDHPELEETNWLDLQFSDIVSQPVETAKSLLEYAGVSVDDPDQAIEKMAQFAAESKAEHALKRQLYSYNIQDFGVEESAFDRGAFQQYRNRHCS